MSNIKAVKNSNMERIMRMTMELCRREPEELIREFGGEKAVEMLNNNIKIIEMQFKIKELEKKKKKKDQEKQGRENRKKWIDG